MPNLTNQGAFPKAFFLSLAKNLVGTDPNVTTANVLVGAVMTVVASWDEFCCNLNGTIRNIAAGSLTLNAVDVPAPTTYYLYVNPSAVVERSTTDPDVAYGENTYAKMARVRLSSNAGTAVVFFLRRTFTPCFDMLNEIGATSADTPPLWVSGFGPTIDAATGEIDVEAGTFQRLVRTVDLSAVTNATILLDDETTVADLEDITTYADGSAIGVGNYHKLLLLLVASGAADYRLLVVRQAVPTVEYATLEEARIDAERRAASGAPAAYYSSALPLAYIEMLLSDASDLDTQDLRQSGVTGGGGGGAPITDHGALLGLGDDDHAQYLLEDGTRAMSGDLDLDGNAIVNYDPQAANTVYAGPTAAPDAAPAFRALVLPDLPDAPFAMASDSTTQSIANIAAAQVITFNTSVYADGITRTSASRYTIVTAGTYLINFSGVARLNAAPGGRYLDAWLRIDGVDVANSNTQVYLTDVGQQSIVAVSFLQTFTAGQYFEFWTWGDSISCQWFAVGAGAAPVRPAMPSIIMTAHRIGA